MKTKEISNMESRELLLKLESFLRRGNSHEQPSRSEQRAVTCRGGMQVDVCRCMVIKPHFKDYFDYFRDLGGAFLSPST